MNAIIAGTPTSAPARSGDPGRMRRQARRMDGGAGDAAGGGERGEPPVCG